MKEELEQKLYEDFSKIFAQKDLPMTQTCMCWGIDCGDGWYDLIYNLCSDIQKYCDANPNALEDMPDNPQIEAVQVKEKFGGLRFYTNYSIKEVDEMINKAEAQSYKICYDCGTTKGVSRSRSGWVCYRCDDCHSKRRNVI